MNIKDRAEMLSGIARQSSSSVTDIVRSDKQAWSDLVKNYPDKWIIYKDLETVDDSREFLCTVLCVCSDDDRISSLKRILRTHKNVGSMRTTSEFNGVMV